MDASTPHRNTNGLVQRLGNHGILVLAAIMPLHAFLSVWLSTFVGHRAVLQGWKEVLIVALWLAAGWLIYSRPKQLVPKLRQTHLYVLAAYLLWSVLVTLSRWPGVHAVAYGIKTDLVFLVLIPIVTVLAVPNLNRRLIKAIIASTAIVTLFGTLQALYLPKDFLSHFGYNSSTIMPFQTLTPFTPATRILSTLGGPNQLGSFLILPMCLVLVLALRKLSWWQPGFLILGLITLLHTYSRSAWIGAASALALSFVMGVPAKNRRLSIIALAVGLLLFGSLAVRSVSQGSSLQYYLFHGKIHSYNASDTSDGQRLQAQSHSLDLIRNNPLGTGLGTAGPASFHTTQPLISENYYLQLGLEMGIVGLLLFVLTMTLIGWQLYLRRQNPLAIAALASLIGVSVINFFLHGWADSSTALIWAVAAGASLADHE